MKIKSILLTAVATISLATATMAQVPNYLPTNGLVGWWPFNGNANDESGNGNNGIVNGPNLTSDRFGNIGNAYSFDGVNDYIEISNSLVTNSNTSFSIFGWFNCDYNNQTIDIISDRTTNNYNVKYRLSIDSVNNGKLTFFCFDGSPNLIELMSNLAIVSNLWNNFTITFDQQNLEYKLYVNGILQQSLVSSSILSNNNTNATQIGRLLGPSSALSPAYLFDGNIDDIGIWNRALTQQEVTDLYNAVNCANNTNITPLTNNLNIGNAATFTATTSDPNPSYVWQSDLGQGFQTLNNFGNYSGVNTASLNIANVQLSEHNQPIRVISTSGNCIDTSNVAIINILDTCITNVTVYDTLLTTVTDTLVINATITGLNPPNNLNTIIVFPNPANDHITINYGNFASMSGYTLKITNNLGQVVFTSPINQQSSYIDLSTWTGNGIYFVQIIDTQNNTIENRKIVIQ